MYRHAKGGSRTLLTRADKRSLIYREVSLLGEHGRVQSLKCPAWLKGEILVLTPARWLRYWNPRTGRPKKVKSVHSKSKKPKKSLRRKTRAITSDKNVFRMSQRETQRRKKASK